MKGLLHVVKLLVEEGADPPIKDPRGRTAQERAKDGVHIEIASSVSWVSVVKSEAQNDFTDRPGLRVQSLHMRFS